MRTLTVASLCFSLAFVCSAVLTPSTAEACGGFFCDNLTLEAIDQRKERILFVMNPDGTITTVVEIATGGDSTNFSWVIPVPETPGLSATTPDNTLAMLDMATTPTIIPPPIDWTTDLGSNDDDAAGDDDDGFNGNESDAGGKPPVDVEDLGFVGPYDAEAVSSDDPAALLNWLIDNGYAVSESMEPIIAHYVTQGMKFLGIKLQPGEGSTGTPPIEITYTATEPMIPLSLTGVSAEPEMGFVVFIVGDQRYEPTNFTPLPIDTDLLQADPRTGETNYYPLLSHLAEQAGRKSFFTEFSDTSSSVASLVDGTWIGTEDEAEVRDRLAEIFAEHSWFTRLYTRMSGIHMADPETGYTDPYFEAAGTKAFSNIYDLSDHDPVNWDMAVHPQLDCNTTYCGEGGVCATTASNIDGCVCVGGFLARRIEAPNLGGMGQPAVTCQDASFDLMAEFVADAGMDPCEGFSCGLDASGNPAGTCVPLGGFPTCLCPDGTAAIANWDGSMSCSAVIDTYGPDQLLWSNWPNDPNAEDDDSGDGAGSNARGLTGSCAGCDAQEARRGPASLLGVLLIALVGFKRRRA